MFSALHATFSTEKETSGNTLWTCSQKLYLPSLSNPRQRWICVMLEQCNADVATLQYIDSFPAITLALIEYGDDTKGSATGLKKSCRG
jgi:hypothetical protein